MMQESSGWTLYHPKQWKHLGQYLVLELVNTEIETGNSECDGPEFTVPYRDIYCLGLRENGLILRLDTVICGMPYVAWYS